MISTLEPNQARDPGELDVSCMFALGVVFSCRIVRIGFVVVSAVVLARENLLIRSSGYIGEKLLTVAFTFLRDDPEPKADMA